MLLNEVYCMRVRVLFYTMLCVLIAGCGLLFDPINSPNPSFCDDAVGEVEGFGRITLPASYAALEVSCNAFMDHHTLHARFDIAPADLATFQQSTLIETWMVKPETTPDFPHSFGTFLDEDEVDDIPAYVYGVYAPLVPVSQQILIDTSDPARYIVYFTAFTSY